MIPVLLLNWKRNLLGKYRILLKRYKKINPEGVRDLFSNQINSSFFKSEIIRRKNELDISVLVFFAEEYVLPFGMTFFWFPWLVCVSPAIMLFLLVFLPLCSLCKAIIYIIAKTSVFSRYFIWGFPQDNNRRECD